MPEKSPSPLRRLKLFGKEQTSAPKWEKIADEIRFAVTSDGTTGPEWIKRLVKKGVNIRAAREVLLSENFKPTSGVTTNITVLSGEHCKRDDRERVLLEDVYRVATEEYLGKLNPETACLIREKFTDRDIADMGLAWIIVPTPIQDTEGKVRLLYANAESRSNSLAAFDIGGAPRAIPRGWDLKSGFAFEK